MAFDALEHASLFHNRERRRDRFARAGLATALANVKLPGPDAAIANPLSGTQEQELATLVARVESFGGSPNGDIIVTGDATDRATLAGDGSGGISLVVRVAGVDEITSGIVPQILTSRPGSIPTFSPSIQLTGRRRSTLTVAS